MKTKLFQLVGLTTMCVLFLGFNLLTAQTKAPGKVKVGSAQTAANNPISILQGEYQSDVPCVDLVVKSGCVSYKIMPLEGDAMAMKQNLADQKSVKICFNGADKGKPTNICPKGVNKFKVVYERADKSTVVGFNAAKAR